MLPPRMKSNRPAISGWRRKKLFQERKLEADRLLGERDRLRDELDAGTRQLADGEFTDYDPAALHQRFDDLKVGKPVRPQ